MFAPYNLGTSTIDPIEESRIRSGRPASRAEIVDRHARDIRHVAAHFNNDLTSPATLSTASEGEGFPVIAFDRVRHSISRFLMSAAERIEPKAA